MQETSRLQTDTTPTLVGVRSLNNPVQLSCLWKVKELRPEGYKVVVERSNKFTVYGLTALASALGGQYQAPTYLVIENNSEPLIAECTMGSSEVRVLSQIHKPGSFELVLSLNTVNQQTVSFVSVVADPGGGIDGLPEHFLYTLTSPASVTHLVGSRATRPPEEDDTMSDILAEIEFDPVGSANSRTELVAGYSLDDFTFTVQFYLTATMAVSYISAIGLSESAIVGQGQLHNYVLLGYDHTGGDTDVLVEGTLTLSNT